MLMSERVGVFSTSHQSDWGYYKQLIELLLVKVNRLLQFHPIFRTAIFFLQTGAGIYSCISLFPNL